MKKYRKNRTVLTEHHRASSSLRGSALERTVFEAPPRVRSNSSVNGVVRPQAEPARHWVTRQSPVTSCWRSAISVTKGREIRGAKIRSAFTLMEVMLVLVIIAAIASLAVMNLSSISGKANEKAAKAKIAVLKGAVDGYRLEMMTYPPDLNALYEQPSNLADPSRWYPILKEPVGPDPWGRPFEYTVSGDSYEIRSLGADGQRSEDDIVG